MADSLGMADVRSLDIDRALKGFSDQPLVFKNFLTVTPTSAREMRWWQKTAGVLTDVTTTGITDGRTHQAFGALGQVQEETATKQTSYAKHFDQWSPYFTYADIRDSDPDMFAANLRGLKRAVENKIDYHILDTLSGSLPLSGGALGTGWGDLTNGNPFLDLLSGSTQIALQGYDIGNVVAWVHPADFKDMINYFVTVKGSSVPQFSSGVVQDGIVTKIANVRIVVSNNATQNQCLMIIPQRAATWKTFTPLTAVTKEEPGVGVQIRVWEDGEVLFTDPNAAFLIKDC